MTPMGRIPGPAELAGTALFLATDDAAPHDRRVPGRRRRLQHGRRLMSDRPRPRPLEPRTRPWCAARSTRPSSSACRGGIAVVGASGALITGSRLDHGGAGGMGRARSKAWIAATQQIPSTEHLHRMRRHARRRSPPASRASRPEAAFPGAGGMPVRTRRPRRGRRSRRPAPRSARSSRRGRRRRWCTRTAGRPTPRTCSSPTRSSMPYVGQHGDDRGPLEAAASATWRDEPPTDSLGHGARPGGRAAGRPRLGARSSRDAVIAGPRRRASPSRSPSWTARGEPMQQDRDGRRPGRRRRTSPLATAAAAALFGMPQRATWPSGFGRGRPPAAPCRVLARCPADCPCVSRAASWPVSASVAPAPFRCAELAAAVLAERG